jgi:hypothetical protein
MIERTACIPVYRNILEDMKRIVYPYLKRGVNWKINNIYSNISCPVDIIIE